MKIILGLGNPGAEYENTRHNAGVSFLEVLGAKCQGLSSYGWRRQKNVFVFETHEFILVKTAGIFMNESGQLLRSLSTQHLAPSTLYVVHDDLDIKLGEYKIQRGKGPKVHNGVESVENALKTKDFWRIRIGVDSRVPNTEHRIPGDEYVLQKFSLEERKVLDGVFEEIVSEITPPHSPS